MGKKLLLAAAAIVLLSLPCAYLLQAERQTPDGEPLRTLTAYIRAAYAHDLRKAYRYIAAEDRRLKSEADYLREKGPFSGFTLDVARKLAELIEARLLRMSSEESRTRVNLSVRLPDANSLSSLLLDWEEDRLNALPAIAQHRKLAAVDDLIRAGKLQMLEGEEEFVVIKEGNSWRVLFDWAAGLRIAFGAKVPAAHAIEAVPIAKETNVQPNELFTVTYRVKNRTGQPIITRIIHRVEPEELKRHLEIVQCGLLLPVKLPPQKELEFTSTYMVRGDLPEGAKNLTITYEFQAAE
jgi:hypothetical protein